jgi:outer membrane protein
MKPKVFLWLFLLNSLTGLHGQDTLPNHYVKMGLESNLALKQKELTYEKSLASLREAKGLFFPNISLNARYTIAKGGRTIDFPVGDLMNPVYSSLNALTTAFTPDQPFPDIQVENQQFSFYRPTEQETKLSLVQPVFNRKIYYKYKMQQEAARAGYLDVSIYKRELSAEIKKAYYTYLQTHYVMELLDQTLGLVRENVRVNESLFRNGKVTPDAVDRSKAELSRVEQQIADAEKNNLVSKAYMNFLLNRSLSQEILIAKDPTAKPGQINMDEMLGSALAKRQEFELMDAYTGVSENFLKLTKSHKVPTLIAVADYGLQGEKYEIDDNADFFLGSLVLKWDLFTGSSNDAKIQQAEIERRILEQQKDELKNQISLEVISAYYDLIAAEKSIESARQQRKSAESAFERINKRYGQGQASLIEYLDARNAMTNAEENFIITLAEYLIRYTELERVAGMLNAG